MKYVQINSFYNGSTGNIMRGLHEKLLAEGHDSYIFWGRRHQTVSEREQCCATSFGVYSHGIRARLTDRAGFYSKHDTAKLLAKLDEVNPDVVHLHNIHGYYINIEMLFRWLKNRNCKIYWTLHDCWSFTGHCPHFEYIKCDSWKTHCPGASRCPQKKEYPKSYIFDNSRRNYADKKRIFTSIPIESMTLITPSRWLSELVKQSFLSEYPIEVRHNEVNQGVFHPMPSDFRDRIGIGNRFMVLGVASPWSEKKGLDDFITLREKLDESYAIVLVGLTKRQIATLPSGIIGLERTDGQKELAQIYSAADVLFNPTKEDNYPTVNLEAEACGTPVITYDVGGCGETIKMPLSEAIPVGDIQAFISAICSRSRIHA